MANFEIVLSFYACISDHDITTHRNIEGVMLNNKLLKFASAPESSNDMSVEYKSENEVRIRWKHYDDERLQHYEVLLILFLFVTLM